MKHLLGSLLIFFLLFVSTFAFQANKTVVTGDGLTTTAAGQPAFVILQLMNGDGTISTQCATFDIVLSKDNVTYPVSQTCTSGTITSSYTVKIAGTYSLTISYQGQKIGKSPYSPMCSPGPIYPPNSAASGQLDGGIVGQKLQFFITPLDVYGNLNTSCTGSWVIKLTGASNTFGQIVACNSTTGIFTANYTATKDGGYDMTVGINNLYLPGSPYHLDFTSGSTDPKSCSASGAASSASNAGLLSVFQVIGKDQYGNLVGTCDTPIADFNSYLLLGSTKYVVNATDCANGVYNLQYKVTKAATYKLNVYISGIAISNNGKSLVISAAQTLSASLTNATGSGLTTGIAGNPATFVIQPYDQYDNKITTCFTSFSDFSIVLTGKSNPSVTCSGQVVSCNEGALNAQYVCYKAITYNLKINYQNQPISGSPFSPTVVPGPISGPATLASGTGLSVAYAGAAANFSLQAYDQYGNEINTCDPINQDPMYQILVYSAVDQSIHVVGTVYGCQKGLYLCSYTVTKISAYILKITYEGNSAANSPYVVAAYPGPPYAPGCTTTGTGLTTATAGVYAPLTTMCTDKYSNPITTCYPDSDWSLVLNKGNTRVVGEIVGCVNSTTKSPASINFRYNATVSGTYQLRLDFYGENENVTIKSASPVVSPAEVDPFNTAAYGPGVESQNIPAGSQTYFTINPRDIFGNNISSCSGISTSDYTVVITPKPTSGPSIQSCNQGKTQVTYTANNAGPYTVRVTYKNTNIVGSPYGVTVVAGALDGPSIVASGPGLYSGIAGVNSEFTLKGRDMYNNTVSTCEPDYRNFKVYLPTPQKVTGEVYSCSNGVYQAHYNATLIGTYTLQISYQNQAIEGSPFHPNITAGASVDSEAVASGNGFRGTVVAGTDAYINVTTEDAFGNLETICTANNNYFSARVTGPSSYSATFTSSKCSNGVYTIIYQLYKAGTYNVIVSGKNSEVSNNNGTVNVIAGGLSGGMSVSQTFKTAVAGSTQNWVIYGLDAYGNNVTSCNNVYSNWTVQAVMNGMMYNGSVSGCTGMSNYQASITVKSVGVFNIVIRYNGTKIANSDFPVNYVFGTVSGKYTTASGLGVNPTTTKNIAGTWTQFNINSYNQYGIKITDQSTCNISMWSVSLSPAPYNPYQPKATPQVLYCTNGVYTVEYNATVAMVFEVDIFLNGVEIAQQNHVRIYPTYLDPTQTRVVVNTNNGAAPDNGTFFLQTKDIYGNDEEAGVEDEFDVRFSPFCANTTVFPTGNVTDGMIEYQYATSEGGIYCIVIYYQDSTIEVPDTKILVTGGQECENACNDKGYCFQNVEPSTSEEDYSCNCFQGWVGDDCSVKMSSTYPLKKGAIIGICFGIAILMLLVGLLLGYCLFKPKHGSDNQSLLSDH